MSVSRPSLTSALALTLAALTLAVPAHADTSLVGSAPVNGSTVTSRPTSVTLDFQNRIIGPAVVAVTGPDGARVDTGEPVVVDTRVQQPVETAGDGRYTVVFRAVADDGHPVKGTVVFVLDAPAEPGFWDTYGAQVVGFLVVLALGILLTALRLRPRRTPGRSAPD